MPTINTNNAANSALRYTNINTSNQTKYLQQLSSGKRITKAADDAASLAIGSKVTADSVALAQASRNAANVQSVLNVAEGGLSNISKVLTRLKELLHSAQDGFHDTASFSAVDKEYQALVTEITNIANTTKFNGVALIDGSGSAATFSNSSGAVILLGATSGDTITMSLSSSGAGNNATATGLSLATTAVTTSAVAATNEGLVETAIGTVAGFLANIGALQARVGFRAAQLDISKENADATASTLLDADVAQAQTLYTNADVLTQSGIAALQKANQIPQSILRLLQS